MRLLLSESMLLAIVAGLTALLIASWSGAVLRTMLFPSVSWRATSVDWRVAAFTLAVTLLAGVAAGVLPAIQSSRADVTQTLKAGAPLPLDHLDGVGQERRSPSPRAR